MDTEEMLEAINREWDINEGFFGQFGDGFFDPIACARAIQLLETLDLGNSATLDRRLVAGIWHLPLFLHEREGTVEQVMGKLPKDAILATNRITAIVTKLMGQPAS